MLLKTSIPLKNENSIFCRNIFVAASSTPFNLIATLV